MQCKNSLAVLFFYLPSANSLEAANAVLLSRTRGTLSLKFTNLAMATEKKGRSVGRGVGGSLADRAARRRPPPARPALLKTASVAPVSAGLSFPDRSRVPTKPQGFGGAE
jgi:hypothetical protein